MLYRARRGQTNYGEAIGILMIDTFEPFIPGEVGNATTFSYPVRYKKVEGFTFQRLYNKDPALLEPILDAARELVREGVRAITGDCGFMALYQREIADAIEVPVFMSSLLQIPFISGTLRKGEKVGILALDSTKLTHKFLEDVGINPSIPVYIKGLEDKKNFHDAAIIDVGELDDEKVEAEIVAAAREMAEDDPQVKSILLECSMLPPYGAAIQEAVHLPVYDFITMIDYVFSAVVKKRFQGFM